MTHINVVVDEHQMATVSMRIDLGQSLMTAQDYWRATQAPLAEKSDYLQPAFELIEEHLLFLIDGEVRPLQMVDFDVTAQSLAAIENPLTPQMATLHYTLDVSNGTRLNVEVTEEIEIPWPSLIKIELPGIELPQSRLLTDVDRISKGTSLSAQPDDGFSKLGLSQLMNHWTTIAPSISWIAVGFTHILPKGLDHMLFILGLFFLAKGWRPLLIQVTGFTIAHSLTLGLSMYGVFTLPGDIVEPLIALSIVYVAIDNLFATQLARFRLLVVCLFGLLHGLGFASVLANIGLPQDQFLTSLGFFNLGVELGQLTVIAAAFLLVGWFRRQLWYQSFIAQPATIMIAGTGAYWFIKRIAF